MELWSDIEQTSLRLTLFHSKCLNLIGQKMTEIKSQEQGHTSLNGSMVKMTLPILLPHITHIINVCFENGYFREFWRKAIGFSTSKQSEKFQAPRTILIEHRQVFFQCYQTFWNKYIGKDRSVEQFGIGFFLQGHQVSEQCIIQQIFQTFRITPSKLKSNKKIGIALVF